MVFPADGELSLIIFTRPQAKEILQGVKLWVSGANLGEQPSLGTAHFASGPISPSLAVLPAAWVEGTRLPWFMPCGFMPGSHSSRVRASLQSQRHLPGWVPGRGLSPHRLGEALMALCPENTELRVQNPSGAPRV